MNKASTYIRYMPWCIALLLGGLAAGCSGNRSPILGTGDIAQLAPTVVAVAPGVNATQVPVNTSTIVVAFSEPMAPITGAASFTVTAAAPALNPVGTVALDATGRIATFTVAPPVAPATSLAPNATYTGTVTGATSIATGLPLTKPYAWSFQTGSTGSLTLPGVVLTAPVTTTPGPTLAVPTNAVISAVFTTDMNPSTLSAASFTVTTPLPGVSPAGKVSYLVGSRTAVFTPSAPLVANTTYTATITKAATDLAGNALAGNQAPLPAASDYVWTFSTAAAPVVVHPMLTSAFPADLATNVANNTVVSGTFNEPMDLSSATFTVTQTGPPAGPLVPGVVTYDALSDTATFTPNSILADSTEYTASITGAKDLAGDPLTAGTVANPWTFTTGASVMAPGAVPLASAGPFGIMATLAITNTGNTIINGDVALNPGTSITGVPPAVVNGATHIDDAVAKQAQADLLTAFNTATALPPGTTVTAGADLGAVYNTGIPAGTYTSGSTMLISTPLVLDAKGNANAVWVFQIGSSLTTNASVSLANGAQAKNVFWVPMLDATVGVGTTFYGSILAGRNVTCITGAIVNGRVLAGATNPGTIALQANVVNVPAQ